MRPPVSVSALALLLLVVVATAQGRATAGHFRQLTNVDDLLNQRSALQFPGAKRSAERCTASLLGYKYSTSHGKGDDRESGSVASMYFTKKRADSVLRLTWSGNIRTWGTNSGGRWYFLIDGKECAIPNKIDIAMYQSTNQNTHIPAVLTGICESTGEGNIVRGNHHISVNTGNIPHHHATNKYTNWVTLSTLEVQELCPQF